jgi:peptide deformylase
VVIVVSSWGAGKFPAWRRQAGAAMARFSDARNDIRPHAGRQFGARPALDAPRRWTYLGAMAILPVITAPDPRLKIKAKRVERVDARIRKLMDDMLETMYAAPGVGLAAPQVGEALCVLVVDVAREGEPRQPFCVANPEIVWASPDRLAHEEGCLSLPDQFAEVTRPAEVKVRYLDRDSELTEVHAKGLLAVCLQHEMDHLEGVLFVDHLSSLRRNIILRRLVKAKRHKTSAVPVPA